VLVTEWHEYRRPDFDRIASLLRTKNVFDGRNVWDAVDAKRRGLRFECIGRPKV